LKLNFRIGSAFASQKARKYLADKNPQDIKNVTVIRYAAIGDYVVMRPFLIELRKFFPNVKITLSTNNTCMYGIPYDLIDELHVIDKREPENLAKKTSFFARLKQIKTLPQQDIIFDLTDSTFSMIVTLFSKSHLKIGYSYRWLRRMFYDVSVLRSDFVLETQSMMHQINVLGANTKHYPLEYQLTNEVRDSKNPYIVYFAGASVQSRCWDVNKFVKLITLMSDKYANYQHIILQGINPDEHFSEIYEPVQSLKNVQRQVALPLEEIYDYLAKSSLVIVGDTGIRNMAIASNTPTLGIMWAPYISPLRYLPKVEEHQVVFNTDFVQPEVEDVYAMAILMIEKLYEK
jgi:ADP-heptose:LPS heptosyltransferase